MNFNEAYNKVMNAVRPEDVFGYTGAELTMQAAFQNLALILHPDKNGSSKEATAAMAKLSQWRAEAKAKLTAGTYGQKTLVTIKTKLDEYAIQDRLCSGDINEIYKALNKASQPVIIKVLRTPANKDLVLNEYKALTEITRTGATKDLEVTKNHLPRLIEQVEVELAGARRLVTILEAAQDFYTLRQVREAYPDGVDMRTAAWMFNRMLGALMACHQAGYVHGAITPEHFLVCPATHNGLLIDWSYAVKAGQKVKAISQQWQEFYPTEVLMKRPVSAASDLFMAASCLYYSLGGDLDKKSPLGTLDMSGKIPRAVANLIRACWLGQRQRPQDVFDLHHDFTQILEKLYGPPKFVPFTMPGAPISESTWA